MHNSGESFSITEVNLHRNYTTLYNKKKSLYELYFIAIAASLQTMFSTTLQR
jgi:hypothetical protein